MSVLADDSLDKARFHALLDEAQRSRACVGLLPFEPARSFRYRRGRACSRTARVIACAWIGTAPETFYDANAVALLPMAFCYPGRGKNGDAPPRRQCAPLWRDRILAHLSDVRLALLVGTYAQAAVLGRGRMSHRVRDYRQYLPSLFPLPHPSWRSQLWIQQNPWFDSELLPTLWNAVAGALSKEPV